jgi:hypothetical protein
MTLLRRHLRLWVAAWIVLQATSLTAFVPRECCIAHRVPVHAEETDESCHRPEPAGESMPDCAMRSTCNGPLAVLAALLSPHAVLGERAGDATIAVTPAPQPAAFDQPRSLALPPEAPPPRR